MSVGLGLAQLLVREKLLDEAEVERAQAHAGKRGLSLERAILSLELAEPEALFRLVAKSVGIPYVDPRRAKVGEELLAKVSPESIEQNVVLPVAIREGVLYVAIDDPAKSYLADDLGFVAGCEVRCALASPGALADAIASATGGGAAGAGAGTLAVQGGGGEGDDDAPIVRLVESILSQGVEQRASDIHIEPFEGRVRVRLRIDGVLREHVDLDMGLHAALTSRLKILAGMDIAERRKPQDGRIEFRSQGRTIDIRTSVIPSNHGESLVMRLLDKEKNLLSLPGLGFGGEDRRRFDRLIKRPNGIILVTGPTGSGKTTTLYAALGELNRPDVKIITAEDPVEFNIAGINQCQVRPTIGLSFARILRAMLRQAPNVILVGEIRDRETAEIAIQAALTGHLVFSTLHTNDAPSAITRLVDMGVKPFLVSAALQAVMAQRLVRVLCKECKESYRPQQSELRGLGLDDGDEEIRFHRPVGCASCDHTGYRGRVGIFELMQMDNELRERAFRGATSAQLREYAQTGAGMSTLSEDGVRKVVEGITSSEELLRVTAASQGLNHA